jgi:hypothetical protein
MRSLNIVRRCGAIAGEPGDREEADALRKRRRLLALPDQLDPLLTKGRRDKTTTTNDAFFLQMAKRSLALARTGAIEQ